MSTSSKAPQGQSVAGSTWERVLQHIDWAELSYKETAADDWQSLDGNYELLPDEKERLLLPANVCDVVINHRGISIVQQAENYKPHLEVKEPRMADRIRCKVAFKRVDCYGFLLDEISAMQGSDDPDSFAYKVITIIFTTQQAPELLDDSFIPTGGPKLPADPEAAKASLVEVSEGLPLATLATTLTSGVSHMFKLVFRRKETTGRERMKKMWNWPATLDFLAGLKQHKTTYNKAIYEDMVGLSLAKLAEHPKYGKHLQPTRALFKFITVPQPHQPQQPPAGPAAPPQQTGPPSPGNMPAKEEKKRRLEQLEREHLELLDEEEAVRVKRVKKANELEALRKDLGD